MPFPFVLGFAGLTGAAMVRGFKKETNRLQQTETVTFY